MRILSSCVASQVSNSQPSVSAIPAAYTFPVLLLFDETFTRPDVFAVMNCGAEPSPENRQ